MLVWMLMMSLVAGQSVGDLMFNINGWNPADVEIGKNPPEAKNEIAKKTNENSKDLNNCLKECKQMRFPEKLVSKCSDGCKGQHNAMKNLELDFPKTPKMYLLGNALDICWQGCSGEKDEQEMCRRGCEHMRTLQKAAKQIAEDSNEDSDESEESKEDQVEDKEGEKENKEGTNMQVMTGGSEYPDGSQSWTYFVVNPERIQAHFDFMDEISRNMLNWMVGSMMNDMDDNMKVIDMDKVFEEKSNINNDGDVYLYSGIPSSRLQDPTSSSPNLSERVSSTLSDLKDTAVHNFYTLKRDINEALTGNNASDNIMCILIGTSLVLIVASILSWVYDSCLAKKIEDDGDYYKLESYTLPPLLPSYDDCVKADKVSLKDINQLGEFYKVDLSYSTPAVVNITDEKEKKPIE